MAGSNTINGNVDIHQEELDLMKALHDEAYLYVSQGLAYQEGKQYKLAQDMYVKGLEKIEKALQVKCNQDYCKGPQWDAARKLQEKIRNTAQLIRSQLQSLSFKTACENILYTPPEPFEAPPTYDEACEHELVSSVRRSSYPIIGNNSALPTTDQQKNNEVIELFCIPDEVQLFYVAYDGSVSTNSSHTSLYIYRFAEEADSLSRPPAWLQVGPWTYPLIPGQSPALESGYGAFLFPNVGAGRDSAVGLILPPSVSPDQRSEFLSYLHELTALKEEKKESYSGKKDELPGAEAAPRSFSETLSHGLVVGAEYLSAGIVKGAAVSSDLIHRGAVKARQKIRPDDQPVIVDPRVRDGLKIAHEASGAALKATGYLVRKLGDLTVALGKQIAPHIREQSTKLLSATFRKEPSDAQDTVDGVLTVAAGGLQGFSTIYMGLENAARQLAYSLSSETVNIVGHKYGDQVGEVVGDALFSVGNLALTTHNVQSLGVKSVAKRTAKDTGKAVLKEYVDNTKGAGK